jgi:hypothetical protein
MTDADSIKQFGKKIISKNKMIFLLLFSLFSLIDNTLPQITSLSFPVS